MLEVVAPFAALLLFGSVPLIALWIAGRPDPDRPPPLPPRDPMQGALVKIGGRVEELPHDHRE